MLTFNLLPPIRKEKRKLQARMGKFLMHTKILLGLSVIFSLFMIFTLVYLEKQRYILESVAVGYEKNPLNILIENIQKEAGHFNKELKDFNENLPKQKWSSLLVETSALERKGITLQQINHTKEKVKGKDKDSQESPPQFVDKLTMSGHAQTRENLSVFQYALEASPLFKNVVLPLSNFEKTQDIDFNISLELQ